jgi:DNA-directed RNA polymerase I subunit RPA1
MFLFVFVGLFLQPALETLMRAQGANDSSDDDDSDDDAVADDVDEESDGNVSDSQTANDGKDKYLAPYEVEARLRLLWDCHSDFLDFVWCRSLSQSTHVSHTWNLFFIRTILVPPSRFRPSADLGDVQAEHPQNLHMSKILTLNETLLKMASKPTNADGKSEQMDMSLLQDKASTDVSKIISIWIDLQNAVNCYLDSTKDPGARKADDSAIGIRQILEKKEGLFRRHMMGKRVNYCCRSVISPDPFLGMNEIGIPVRFAKELHYPTPVTSWNIKLLRQMVENGPDIYPGLHFKYWFVSPDEN